ncbi:MAG: MBL fold metallo-hydrolase [Hespellia sp.]|jgi:hydroxyacylglutathione hydrolase|nr:MBL fold metallo-hydrolase [Hespellia sp.]
MMEQENYKKIEAGDGLWIIEEPMVRCFLLVGTKKALMIDSGCVITNAREIAETITDLPIMLANTHADGDHVNGNAQFEEIYMHPAEYAYYHHAYKKNEQIKPLWDGDTISLGDREVRVISNPGHTPGSVTFLDIKGRRLIGGDSIQNGNIFMFKEVRDLLAYLYSLEKVNGLAKQFDMVYPSHAQCPISKEIIPRLIEETRRMLEGEIDGTPDVCNGTPIRVFPLGSANILYDAEKQFFEFS